MPDRDFFRIRFSTPRMSADGSEAEIMLYGEIIGNTPENWKWAKEDMSASDFDKAVKGVRESGAKRLLLRINSPGGLVTESVAMRGILGAAGFEEIIIRIEGMCASAATVIATIPGAHVQIAPGSEYMIHNPWTVSWGNADQLESTAQHLRAEEATARGFYAKKTGQTDEQIKKWMDAETWFTSDEAVKYGFADELLDEGGEEAIKAMACVTPRTMDAMKALYRNIPSGISVTIPKDIPNQQRQASGKPSENTNTHEEDNGMEIKDVTLEQLRAENPELLASIMQTGAQAERERIAEIDALTTTGYEAMAEEAKRNGVSAMDFHKQIVKAQAQKGKEFLEQRRNETTPAMSVRGGSSEEADGKLGDAEMDAFAKEIAGYAKGERAALDGNMY